SVQPLLERPGLDPLLTLLLDLRPLLGEDRQPHGGLGTWRDDPVALPERPDLGLGAPGARLDIFQLVLDEPPRLADARVPQRLVEVAVRFGGGRGEVARLAPVRR